MSGESEFERGWRAAQNMIASFYESSARSWGMAEKLGEPCAQPEYQGHERVIAAIWAAAAKRARSTGPEWKDPEAVFRRTLAGLVREAGLAREGGQ